jgi:hypothetical protein
MSRATVLPLRRDARGVSATPAPGAARLLTALHRLEVDGALEVTTGDEEACAILLGGTFDLVGGTTAWPSRGARTTPLGGRPVAVFLPPRTPFAARNGRGEILLICARQPAVAPATGRAALQQSPLLPLAGSGKAFDPGSGEWRPAETFPSAPESLPPRRIERVTLGAVTVERVFAADYKAATLTVDEVAVPAGATFLARSLPLPAAARECMVYLRCEAELALTGVELAKLPAGEHALLLDGPATTLGLVAGKAPVYVVLAHAGKAG